MKKSSIVHYWGGVPKNPTSRFWWHLRILEECGKRGFTPIIVFSQIPSDPEINEAIKTAGIEVVEIPRPRGQFDMKCIWETRRFFKEVDCCLAHFHCVHTSPIIGAAAALIPVRVWSLHSANMPEDGTTRGGLHRLEVSTRVTAALSHLMMPVSKALLEDLRKVGVSENRMEIAPVPVNVGQWQGVTREEARAELGYSADDLIITSVGRAVYLKAWDVLVDGFMRVAKRYPSAKLLLVGEADEIGMDPVYLEKLDEKIKNSGCADRIFLLGQRADVQRLLAASDLFAFSTRAEGLPGALAEAMATGLPCVATGIAGNEELIEHEKNGLLVPVGDGAAMGEAMLELCGDEKRREELGTAARDSLESVSQEYQVARVIGLYKGLLAARGFEFDLPGGGSIGD